MPSTITTRFEQRFGKSRELAARAQQRFPSGVTHDGRYLEPFPVFIDHAAGSTKFSVEGHPIIDYWVGHGALLLGHSHPAVVQAVQEQMTKGTHYSAGHALEIEWADRICQMVPSAERVRFTNSGTEATLMALRVARLVTGKRKVLKFIGHFHGWHDFLVPAAYAPYDPNDWTMPGVTPGVMDDLVVMPPGNLDVVAEAIRVHQPACLIVEATGGHWGTVPMRGEFLQGLRDLTQQHGVILIFDEVITGFRAHAGGAQAAYDVKPDMTTLAKILAGGLPGGALVGRADLLDAIAFNNQYGRKMRHPGTFNGNPLSAAAGCAALDLIANNQPCDAANRTAKELRRRLNTLFAEKHANWCAYGDFSMIHILTNYDGPRPTSDDFIPCDGDYTKLDAKGDPKFLYAFRAALLLGGADWFAWGGMTSSAHTPQDLDTTVAAFDQAIDLLRTDGWMK